MLQHLHGREPFLESLFAFYSTEFKAANRYYVFETCRTQHGAQSQSSKLLPNYNFTLVGVLRHLHGTAGPE